MHYGNPIARAGPPGRRGGRGGTRGRAHGHSVRPANIPPQYIAPPLLSGSSSDSSSEDPPDDHVADTVADDHVAEYGVIAHSVAELGAAADPVAEYGVIAYPVEDLGAIADPAAADPVAELGMAADPVSDLVRADPRLAFLLGDPWADLYVDAESEPVAQPTASIEMIKGGKPVTPLTDILHGAIQCLERAMKLLQEAGEATGQAIKMQESAKKAAEVASHELAEARDALVSHSIGLSHVPAGARLNLNVDGKRRYC